MESGVHIGPASSITWLLRELVARLVSCGSEKIYRRASSLVGWVVFPLKYFDLLLERLPHMHTVASSCYYIGRKVE
jgi:hypothetical protein